MVAAVTATQTGVARPARKPKRERWRQVSFNFADGFAAAELEDDMGSKGAQPKMPKGGKGKVKVSGDDVGTMQHKAASAFKTQDNSRKGSAKAPRKRAS